MNFLLTLFLFVLSCKSTNATEASPSVVSDKVEDVKDILKQIVKSTSNNDEVETVSDKPKSIFGSITAIDTNQITLNFQNQTKVIRISDETTFIDSKRQKSKLTNFKVGQTILSMGYLQADQSLDCKRVVFTDTKSIENTNQIVTGQIVDVSQSQTSPIFVLIPTQNKNSQYQIKTDSKTEIIDLKNNKLTLSKTIISGKKIIAIIKPDSQLAQTFYASKIINLESATESISPSPTSKP